MRLVQRLAIIRVSTTPHFVTATFFYFNEPIRVSQRLACKPDNIRLTAPKNFLSLLEHGNTSGRYHRCLKAGFIHRALDSRDQRDAPAEWASLVREHSRHALIAALT